MLDLGQSDFAWKIAKTALDIWKRETDETYCCMEHWVVDSGRGAGWHQFGGLSAPVLSWFGAYFVPGRLTTGFDLLVVERKEQGSESGLTADLKDFGPRPRNSSVVVVLSPEGAYHALWGGSPVPMRSLVPGTWSIELPVVPGRTRRLEILATERE
jgi:hypothetical protein